MQQVDIIIDKAEPASFKKMLTSNGVKYKIRTLPVGDIAFVSNKKIKLLIERKSISDLKSSIIDGRYKNQKARMLRLPKHIQIVYLIEGKTTHASDKFEYDKEFDDNYLDDIFASSHKKSKIPDTTVKAAITHMIVRDKIPVIRTDSMWDTVQEVMRIAGTYELHPELLTNNADNTSNVDDTILNPAPTTSDGYYKMNFTKNSMLTKSVYYQCILEGVPTIGPTTAKKIMNKITTHLKLTAILSKKTPNGGAKYSLVGMGVCSKRQEAKLREYLM